ncbi:MAG: diguanylate cyclase [Treponema sp.]|nr:diguanylate cyclase [Treponema sp.]
MKQYRYVLTNQSEITDFITAVKQLLKENPAAKALLQVIEPKDSYEAIAKELNTLVCSLPDVMIYGMTSASATTSNITVPDKTVCTLILFEKSNYKIFHYNCHVQTTLTAGKKFLTDIHDLPDLKGVLMMSSDIMLGPDDFIGEFEHSYPDVPIFGAVAASYSSNGDTSAVFIGDAVYDREILTIAFYGKELHIDTTYDLGWKAVGKEFVVTKSDAHGIVETIDNQPAVSIYVDYLGVETNTHFFGNVVSFPFIYKIGTKQVARIPFNYEGTKLIFGQQIPEGTKASLSYAKSEYLLKETLKSANGMLSFAPDAILIFCCLSRRILMGDRLADRECEYFQNVNENASWVYGYSEILCNHEAPGLLNGAFIAVAFREGPVKVDPHKIPYVDSALGNAKPVLSSNDRLISFLEKTSADLRRSVDELSYLASHDQLTGILNRTFFNGVFKKNIEHMSDKDAMGVLMLDIDHFKHINDTYGHNIGDVVLKQMVGVVSQNLPQSAAFSRWGGEEFMCIVPSSSKEDILALAQKLLTAVSSADYTPVPMVTVSIGVTLANHQSIRASVFRVVDEALYEAKNTGRNRVVFLEPEDTNLKELQIYSTLS